MPYISKFERELAGRCNLIEFVPMVRAADGCSVKQAHSQIRGMLADSKLSPLWWDPSPGEKPPDTNQPWCLHWLNIDIDWKTGRVLDDFDRTRFPNLWDTVYEWSRELGPNDPLPRDPARRMLWLDRTRCEAICAALRLAREQAALGEAVSQPTQPEPKPGDEAPLNSPGTQQDPPQTNAEGGAGAKKLGYGEVGPALRDALKTHETKLSAIPTRKARAEFLAPLVGCSPSSAEKLLKIEGK